MFDGMEGSTLGIWSAHGEGRAYFPDANVHERVRREGLVPLRFVDDDDRVTEAYPFNPNGSPEGIAGLCSPDGRHLAMMPHPERTVLKWQWGWMPRHWRCTLEVSPGSGCFRTPGSGARGANRVGPLVLLHAVLEPQSLGVRSSAGRGAPV